MRREKQKGRREEEEKRRRGAKLLFGDSSSDENDARSFSNLLFSSSPLLPFCFLHLLIALPLAYFLNIWADEASTLYTTRSGLAEAFRNVSADEKQAPLYFLLMSLWREINDSVFFARIFSIICSLAAIVVFARLARKIWDAKTAAFVTAVFALHPYLFWASLEIRLYSLVILLTCLLFLFFIDGYLREDSAAKRARIFYILTAIAALYTNYYLGFTLVGAFAALLFTRRFRQAKIYFLQMLIVGIFAAPLFYFISLQFADRAITFQAEKSLIEGIKIIWNHFLTFTLPTEIFTSEESSVISFVRLWLVRLSIVGVLLIALKNRLRSLDKNIIAFGTIAAVCAAFFLLVYFQLGSGYAEIRHAAIYFTAIYLFVSAVLVKLAPKKSWVFFALLYGVFFSYALYALYPDLTKRGDWERVAQFISEREKPNQPIIVFSAFEAVALPVYYQGANEILPDEKHFSFFAEAEAGNAETYRRQIDFIIGKVPLRADEIWLVTSEKCDIKEACAPLENFVRANYTISEEKIFYKGKVRLLKKKK